MIWGDDPLDRDYLQSLVNNLYRIANVLDPPDDMPAPDTPLGKIAGVVAEKLAEKFSAGVTDELANRVLRKVSEQIELGRLQKIADRERK